MVTGASSGIGQAIALELAAGGADLVLCARRSRERLDHVSSEVAELGSGATELLCDLADVEQLEGLAARAWEWRGRVDAWINNAGADVLTGDAANWPFEAKLDALWKCDVRATLLLCRLVGARMKTQGGGVIVNMGWDQAATGMAGDSGELFAATKGAIMAATKSLARSLAPQVRVNCLAPGWIKTAWGENASGEWQRRAVDESLLGRWGQPEDVARVARFLVSDDASFMTGQVVAINGGMAVV